jgi:hypothetical protein
VLVSKLQSEDDRMVNKITIYGNGNCQGKPNRTNEMGIRQLTAELWQDLVLRPFTASFGPIFSQFLLSSDTYYCLGHVLPVLFSHKL